MQFSLLLRISSAAWQGASCYERVSSPTNASCRLATIMLFFFFLSETAYFGFRELITLFQICSGCRCDPGGAKRTERAQRVWLFCFMQACTGNSASSKWKDIIHKSLWNIEIMIKPGTGKTGFSINFKITKDFPQCQKHFNKSRTCFRDRHIAREEEITLHLHC